MSQEAPLPKHSWRISDPGKNEPDGALILSSIRFGTHTHGRSAEYVVESFFGPRTLDADNEHRDIAPGWCLRTLEQAFLTQRSILDGYRSTLPDFKPDQFFGTIIIKGFGWPTISAAGHSQRILFVGSNQGMQDTFQTAGYKLSGSLRSLLHTQETTLAISPVWPGFAINTLFYAILFAIPAPLVLWLTRRRRRRLGHCVKCNYNLAGLADGAACPECGTSRQPVGRPFQDSPS